MQIFSKNKVAFVLLAAVGALGLTGCQNSANTTVAGNQTNISNVPGVGNVNVITNTNSNNLLTGESVGIEAREPEQYQATVTLKLETGGADKTTALPNLSANVAKSGTSKRMEFAIPGGEKAVYLERDGRQLVIFPQRKQYAELNREALGFDIRQLLTPEQIVKKIQNLKGAERVGEEKFGDRDVIRYRYNATAQTNNPQTGNVATDAVVLVDKETGLPLRSETFAESQNAVANGMKSLRVVTEMTNLQMTAGQDLFAEPTDFKKVSPEEVRSQVDLIFRALGMFMQQAMNNQPALKEGMSNQNTNVNAMPTATP